MFVDAYEQIRKWKEQIKQEKAQESDEPTWAVELKQEIDKLNKREGLYDPNTFYNPYHNL